MKENKKEHQKEKQKKKKWWKILIAILIIVGLAGVGSWKVMDYVSRQAMVKIEKQLLQKAQTGELELPEGFVFRPEEGTGASSQEEEQPAEQAEPDQPETEQQEAVQQGGQSTGGGGIDLSYASAIASVASSEDIAAAYSAVLGCLSAADKQQIAAYLKNGQESEAYSLVYSRITGDAYATLAGLYYKYLPMVQ